MKSFVSIVFVAFCSLSVLSANGQIQTQQATEPKPLSLSEQAKTVQITKEKKSRPEGLAALAAPVADTGEQAIYGVWHSDFVESAQIVDFVFVLRNDHRVGFLMRYLSTDGSVQENFFEGNYSVQNELIQIKYDDGDEDNLKIGVYEGETFLYIDGERKLIFQQMQVN
ncbi:MAG: hypothetical protein R3C03_10060 [Pirellulaceae bacterium]